VKFSKRLVATTAIAIALFACDKDFENALQASTPEIVQVSARLAAATAKDSALLKLTDSVIVNLDTGSGSSVRNVFLGTVGYSAGGVALPALPLNTPYALAYKGLVGKQVIWSGSVNGQAVKGAQTTLTVAATAAEALKPVRLDTVAVPSTDSVTVTLTPGNDAKIKDVLVYSTDNGAHWTVYDAPFRVARSTSVQAKDGVAGISIVPPAAVVIPAAVAVVVPDADTLTGLADLNVAPNVLQPSTFSKDELRYRLILAAAVAKVSVTAIQVPQASQAIAINGSVATSGVASDVSVKEIDSIQVTVTNTKAKSSRTYTIEVLHHLPVPVIAVNAGNFTLSHAGTTQGTLFWRFANTGSWTKYDAAMAVTKDTTIEYLDSLATQSSDVGSYKVKLDAKLDTLKAPVVVLKGTSIGSAANEFLGSVSLSLNSSNASAAGTTLQWSTDKLGWTDWTSDVTLYASAGTTIYVKETRQNAFSVVGTQPFKVTPYTVDAPALTRDVSVPGAVTVKVKSQNVRPVVATLYCRVNGEQWAQYTAPVSVASGETFYAKDSALGQISAICSTKVAIPSAPTVTPAATSGKGEQVWVGVGSVVPSLSVINGKEVLKSVGIACASGFSQYSLDNGDTWKDSSAYVQENSGTVLFQCKDRTTGVVSVWVKRDFMLFQPPLVSVSDTTFADTLTVKVQTRQNAQYLQSCVGDTNACEMDSVLANSSNWVDMKGVTGSLAHSRDTLLSETTVLWTRSRLDNYVSHPTKRIFRKATSVTYEGQTYKTVKIGTQMWMAQNLNYGGTQASPVGTCYLNSADSCKKYGRLYTWAEAMGVASFYNDTLLAAKLPSQGICPTGWHIPSVVDWATLEQFVDSATAATSLKSTSGWTGGGNGTDRYGFTALPAGYSEQHSGFKSSGTYAFFWTTSEQATNAALSESLNYGLAYPTRANMNKSEMASVRCLQD